MSNYSIYLRSKDDKALQSEAKIKGITPVEVLKKRLENTIHVDNYNVLQLEINALQIKINELKTMTGAVFTLLELLAKEIGYTSGATRAASAHIPRAVSEGLAIETILKNAIKTLRSSFEKDGSEVG